MKTKNLLAIGLLLGGAFMTQPASAQFVLVDNFSSETAGNLAGQTASDGGTWTNLGSANAITVGAAPTGNGTGALESNTGIVGAAALALPNAITGSSTAATIFFQFDLGGATPLTGGATVTNANWDLETPGSATNGGGGTTNPATAFQLNINVNGGRNGITVRNGGAFDEMSANGGTSVFTPNSNALYDMWVVLNQSASTYQVYMASPNDSNLSTTPTLMSIGTGAYAAIPGSYTTTGAYRAANALPGDFVFGNGNGNNSFSEGLYSIYEDNSGVDLVNPVPEPGSLLLFALGLSGLALVYRLRRPPVDYCR
jgi:hypothetical protein